MSEALRPLGIELRTLPCCSGWSTAAHGPAGLGSGDGLGQGGVMRVVDDLERKGLAVRKSVRGTGGCGRSSHA